MKRILMGLLCCAACAGLTPSWADVARKNILLILADDQGFCESGAYMDFASAHTLGSHLAPKYRDITACTAKEAPIDVCFEAARRCTPTIDALAQRGVRFTRFYAAPTCAPSRAALMSGRYPQGFGVYANDDVIENGATGIPAEVRFPVKLFQDAVYMTGLIGKWHLGMERPGQHPNDRGFDYFFGFDRAHTEKYGSRILQRNKQKAAAEGWLADQISDEAVAFVRRAHKANKPFFLYVAYNEPHGPTPRPPAVYIDHFKSGSDIVDVHFATIYGMDQGIGRILDELERTGRREHTLVFYGSDNGLAQGAYHHGFNAKEGVYTVGVPGNGPLRGCKWTPWEGGVRVPFIACLPDGAAKTSAALTSIMDVLPTALEYAGLRAPADYPMDGRSFLPVLRGTSDGDPDRTLFWALDADEPYGDWSPEHLRLAEILRARQKAKTPRPERFPPAWYVCTPEWKLMGWDTLPPVLIDMRNDPYERQNVAATHPEVTAALRRRFDEWLARQVPPQKYSRAQWSKLRPTTTPPAHP